MVADESWTILNYYFQEHENIGLLDLSSHQKAVFHPLLENGRTQMHTREVTSKYKDHLDHAVLIQQGYIDVVSIDKNHCSTECIFVQYTVFLLIQTIVKACDLNKKRVVTLP